jgi:hypothetical protein
MPSLCWAPRGSCIRADYDWRLFRGIAPRMNVAASGSPRSLTGERDRLVGKPARLNGYFTNLFQCHGNTGDRRDPKRSYTPSFPLENPLHQPPILPERTAYAIAMANGYGMVRGSEHGFFAKKQFLFCIMENISLLRAGSVPYVTIYHARIVPAKQTITGGISSRRVWKYSISSEIGNAWIMDGSRGRERRQYTL